MNRIAKFFRDYSLARFLLPLGLILLVVSVFLWRTANTRQGYPQTDAVVSRAELEEEAHYEGNEQKEATYRIFVKYTVDGREYEEDYGVHPEMKPGTTVRIDYNPKDPHDIMQPIASWLPIAVMAAGIGSLAGCAVSIVNTRKKNLKLKKQEEEWKHGS